VQLNLVDEDSRELVSAWLMTVAATSPAVMRSYDVDVPGTFVGVVCSPCVTVVWTSCRRACECSGCTVLLVTIVAATVCTAVLVVL
jgi:hypothetical protein